MSRPVATAHAVAPRVMSFAVTPPPGPPGPAGRSPGGVLARLDRPHTHRFDLVGASWRAGTLDAGSTSIEVQVHHNGRWSAWSALAPDDGGADGGTADARRSARVHTGRQSAEPVWVGAADGVRTRVVGVSRPVGVAAPPVVPSDLHVVLVDGGTSAADAHPRPAVTLGGSDAQAAEAQPTIYTRADWGADESLRRSACPNGPDYSPTVLMGFVHHTESGNGYTRSQVPGIIRSIYAYHVQSNGWCDIGYNFLVDRFGRIWEGRYGGMTKPVIGAHTGGYNYDTFAASLIGSYTSLQPSAEMLSALEKLFAWKLGSYYRDPLGKTTLTAAAFSGSRYAAGTRVTLKTVSGHRDADYTSCPGDAAYADLPEIRAGIAAAMGAGFVSPAVDQASAPMGAGSINVGAHVVGRQSWQLTVADATGTTLRTITGAADRQTPVAAAWDLTDDAGAPVPPGTYTLNLTGATAGGAAALPWSTTVTVTPPVSLDVPAQTALGHAVKAHGTGVAGHSVTVSVTGSSGTQQLGTFTVSSTGKWSAGTAVDAAGDLAWTATDPAVSSYHRSRRTRVAPWVSSPTGTPAFVSSGTALSLQGTALPAAATVHLMTRPTAGGATTTGPDVRLASDGTWSTSLSPTVPTTYWVADSRGLASPARVVYPVSAPTASAPSQGYAGRQVTVRGNAGGAPVEVILSTRPAGGSWSTVKTVTAAADGGFSVRLRLPSQADSTTAWRVATGYGAAATGSVRALPVFPPTVKTRARVGWNTAQTFTGTAVPGDIVTVWTAPAGTTGWKRLGTARAAGDSSWTLPARFSADTSWRVTSPSGTSATGTTVVVPTIHAPASVSAGAPAVIHGTGLPGASLQVFRRADGASTWTAVATLTVAGDGSWTLTRRLRHAASFRAVSHGQTSRAVSISIR